MNSVVLQNTFYILGIIFMMLMIFFMVAVVAAIFLIKRKINDIQRNVEEKLGLLKYIGQGSAEMASGIGSVVGSMAVRKIKKIMGKKKGSKSTSN